MYGKGDTYVASLRQRLWLTDRGAWTVFAFGIAAMFVVFWVSLVFEGYGDTVADILHRARLRAAMLFAAAALAISGPLFATISQRNNCRTSRHSEKKSKFVGLEEL